MQRIVLAFKSVFSQALYGAVAIVSSLLVFSFAVWFPNYTLIFDVLKSMNVSRGGKLEFLIGLWGSIETNFTFFSATYTIFISLLAGVYISFLLYYLARKRSDISQSISLGVGGVLSGMLGIGCAACGSFLFATFLSFAGASGAIFFLPLEGMEFGIIGVVLLLGAIFLISKKITDPAICPIPD